MSNPPVMTHAMAMAVYERCRQHALEKGHRITVTVVDKAGRLMLTIRDDGTGFFTPDTSRGKAVASAGFRRRTADIDKEAGQGFYAAVPVLLPGQILTSPGGSPIIVRGEVVGGVGVGGAPAEMDQEIADIGAAAAEAVSS